MTERDFAVDVVKRLREAGYQALWAGGCVRDELLGLPPKDYDVATDARPDDVRRLFRRTIAVGASFGVVEVLGPRHEGRPLKIQVATFRSDVSYSDGRHPDEVRFSGPREDALRRDFTINGMFKDPLTGDIIDYVGGQDDLLGLVGELQRKVQPGSVVVLQSERGVPLEELPDRLNWDRRTYGRNELFLWVKEAEAAADAERNGREDERHDDADGA